MKKKKMKSDTRSMNTLFLPYWNGGSQAENIRFKCKPLTSKMKGDDEFEILKERFNKRLTAQEVFEELHYSSLLSWSTIFCSVSCNIILIVSWLSGIIDASSFVVGILNLIILIINFVLLLWNRWKTKNEIYIKISRIQQLVKEYQEEHKHENDVIQDKGVDFLTQTSTYTQVYQNELRRYIPVPTSLVQQDDVIGIVDGQTIPCDVECDQDGCIRLEKNEIFLKSKLCSQHKASLKGDHLYKFTVMKRPAVMEISSLFCQHKSSSSSSIFNRPHTIMEKRRELMQSLIVPISIAVFILSFLIGSFWFAIDRSLSPFHQQETTNTTTTRILQSRDHPYYYLLPFFVRPSLILLPLLPVLGPIIWILLYSVGELKTIQPVLNNQHDAGAIGDEEKPPKFGMMKLLWKLLRDNNNGEILYRTSPAFDILGSLTVLCSVNKEGILSWYEPAPEKIFFFHQLTRLNGENNGTSDEGGLGGNTVANNPLQKTSGAEVLNLSRDSNQLNKFQFDETDWAEHMTSLKPIGLNMMILHSIRVSSYHEDMISKFCKLFSHKNADYQLDQKCHEALLRHQNLLSMISYGQNSTNTYINAAKHGLQALAELIGFSQQIRLVFPLKGTHTHFAGSTYNATTIDKTAAGEDVDSDGGKSVGGEFKYMQSAVIRHRSGEMYELKSGDSKLLLSQCDRYWDGKQLQTFDVGARRKVDDFVKRCSLLGPCVSFTFKQITHGSGDSGIPHVRNPSNNIVFTPIQDHLLSRRDIFLGAVSLQHQTRDHVINLTDQLEQACIRFVHFSADDESCSRLFAEKMGLEVGWNCHITLSNNITTDDDDVTQDDVLGDDDVITMVEDDVMMKGRVARSHSYRISTRESAESDVMTGSWNRAKLPRGIDNILSHIENVDNVPLQVPLFTDCNTESTRRMIEIMQKYGEVVCCIGSCDSINNMSIFSQADISVGIAPHSIPLHPRHEQATKPMFYMGDGSSMTSSHSEEEQLLGSTEFNNITDNKNNKTREAARSINTFPCSVIIQNTDEDLAILYQMIKQARHFLFTIRVSLIFYTKSLASLSLAQLFALLLHLPMVFTARDVFWLSYIISPLLSFSLLFSPCDPDLMKWTPTKNCEMEKKAKRMLISQNLQHFTIKFVPSIIVVVIIFTSWLSFSCINHLQPQIQKNATTTAQPNVTSPLTITIECYPHLMAHFNNGKIDDYLVDESRAYMQSRVMQGQQIAATALVMYWCVISIGYVHRWRHLKTYRPTTNKVWICAVIMSLFLQFAYSTSIIVLNERESSRCLFQRRYPDCFNASFLSQPNHLVILLSALFWIVPCFAINELAKNGEIKTWRRNERRARLDFGTKLGMNSPF